MAHDTAQYAERTRARVPWAAFFAIAVAAFAVHAGSLHTAMVSDDYDIFAGLHLRGWRGCWPGPGEPFARPLTTVLNQVTYLAFGLEPLPHHLVNLGMHIGCAWGAGLLARALLPEVPLAMWFVGLWFAVSPGHVECVAWISDRYGLLAALLGMVAVLAWLRFRRPGGHRGQAVLAVVVFTLATLAKETVAAVPLMFVVLDLAQRQPRRRVVGTIALAVGMLGLAALLRWWTIGAVVGGPGAAQALGLGPTALLRTWGAMMWRPFFPSLPAAWEMPWRIAAAGLAVGVVLRAFSADAGRARRAATCWLLAGLAGLPIASLPFDASSVEGSRLYYWPSVWTTTGIVALLAPDANGAGRRRLPFLLLLGLPALSALATLAAVARWSAAGALAEQWIGGLAGLVGPGNNYLLNVPDSRAGAFVFRNGIVLGHALRNGLPPGPFVPVALVRWSDRDTGFVVEQRADGVEVRCTEPTSRFLPPQYTEATLPDGSRYTVTDQGPTGYTLHAGKGRAIWWNGGTLHAVPLER